MTAAVHPPASITTERVKLPTGATLTVDRVGKGPTVLLLHGIGGFRQHWHGLMQTLADRFHLIAWDARGYGDSADAAVADFADFADDLEALMTALGIARALAIGHSMGGRILLEAAARFPDRFAGLVLVGAQPAYLKEMSEADRRAYLEMREALFDEQGIRRERLASISASLVADASSAAARATEAGLAALHREGYLAALSASLGMDRTDILPTLAMPVEIVGGSEDRVCPPAICRETAEAIGQKDAVILDGVGHMVPLESPTRFAAIAGAFLDLHGTGATIGSADTPRPVSQTP